MLVVPDSVGSVTGVGRGRACQYSIWPWGCLNGWIQTGGSWTSPLLLLPCELERASPRSPFILRCAAADLAAKLRNDFGIELPELDFDTATPGECLDAYRYAFKQRRDGR